jgi:5-formyltetrahydrofolate cyclo-ligase
MTNKNKLRKKFREIRSSISEEEAEEKSRIIIETLFSLDEFRNARNVLFYVDTRNEVKTRNAITRALDMRKRVAVPKVLDHGMIAVVICSLSELRPGRFGIYEPLHCVEMQAKQIELVVVPGVAFDKRGFRLGYGGGYYDRFLPCLCAKTVKAALAYEIQLTDKIPADEQDIKVDIIITEKAVYRRKV